MDDSEVVTFGPQPADKEAVEDTLQESELESARIENIVQSKMTEQLAGATRREMRQLVDECLSEFSDRVENMFANFENRLGTNGSTHFLGGGLESTPRITMNVNNRDNMNNSHAPGVDCPREKVEINCKIKPQLYDGSDDLDEYLTQFNILAELHGWNSKTKALFLASSLSGGARALLNEMSDYDCHNYDSLVEALKSRFGSTHRSEVFRAELQTRVRFRNETLPELAQAIKKLTRRAYPGTPPVVRDTLALDYFIDAIPESEIRLRLREVGPKTINEAENIAVRLEALRVADRQKGKAVRSADALVLPNEIREIKNSIQMLRNDVSSIKTNSLNTKGFQNNNFNKRQGNDGSFNNYRRNGNFRKSVNDQLSSSRVGTRQDQRGPTQ